MAPSQQSRVLRCCSCRLFQAHQVKKSLKWTCKACGEKQSFLRVSPEKQKAVAPSCRGRFSYCPTSLGRIFSSHKKVHQAYGEGSGADCRRHVQKLNLLQGQVSELSLRSLEEAVSASEEKTGHQQAENKSLQAQCQPSGTRWLKYLDKGCAEQEPGGEPRLHTQPVAGTEPGSPFGSALPRKRKWSQSTDQSPHSLDVQDLDDAEVTLEPPGYAGLIRTLPQGSTCCLQSSVCCHTRALSFPRWKRPSPALQVAAPSPTWARFLLSPGNSSHVDTELPRPVQTGPRPASPAQAEQGTPRTETPREGCLSSPPAAAQLPRVTHTPTSRPESSRKTCQQLWGTGTPQTEGGLLAQGAQKAPPVRLCDLFATGEDFEDDPYMN